MAFVQRRVFCAKVGMAELLVNHFKEAEKSWRQMGFNLKTRMLTDFESGRSDRVAVEWEFENPGELTAAFSDMMSKPGAQDAFGQWEAEMNEMIHYSEAENWQVR